MNTECQGIHQSDVLIRAALVNGIAELRRQPWLLDYVFASLPQDKLTAKEYGEKEVEQAKKWFLRTEIPVMMNYRVDEPVAPSISIALLESGECEETLGDVNYKPVEETVGDWPMLAGPFSVESYSSATGQVTLPEEVGKELVVVEGMILIDDVGQEHPIIEVVDRRTVFVQKGLNVRFSKACIRSEKPTHTIQLESLNFRETYQLGCHASAEPAHLLYLHSIAVFIMLREKQELMEKRGFERSTITSAQVAQNPNFEGKEIVWSRFVNVTGYVRNFWPKKRSMRTGYIQFRPTAAPVQSDLTPGTRAVSIFTEEDE